MTNDINLFDLFTVDRRETERSGGTFFEILNPSQDGVLFVPVSLADLVNETLSNLPLGETR
jgi:hypothetical protein